MINRIIEFPSRQSFFLFGARQTGKSTLIHTRLKKAWVVNLLNSGDLFKYLRDLSLFGREAREKIKSGIGHIVIDEIQRAPLLLDEIQALMFDHPRVQFVLTGSSARKLKRGAANLLGGRAAVYYLFPFVYAELKNAALEDILRWGTLPALMDKTEREKKDILNAYGHVYLQEEIKSEGIARNLPGFTRFLDMAAGQSGELVSFSSIARECYLPVRTVQSYYEILEDTMIGARLQAWDKSLRKRIVAHPKFYLFDLGVGNAINRRLSGGPDRQALGRLFEQFIILETDRMRHYLKSDAKMFFWRTNHGAEVDLLIEKNGKITAAIEIKYMDRISTAELTGLRSFKEEYPKTPSYLVGRVGHSHELNGVHILPWQEYLRTLSKFL